MKTKLILSTTKLSLHIVKGLLHSDILFMMLFLKDTNSLVNSTFSSNKIMLTKNRIILFELGMPSGKFDAPPSKYIYVLYRYALQKINHN